MGQLVGTLYRKSVKTQAGVAGASAPGQPGAVMGTRRYATQ
jgi:hypothetical protein